MTYTILVSDFYGYFIHRFLIVYKQYSCVELLKF